MNLFRLMAELGIDTSKYERSVRDAEEKASDLESSMEGAGRAADKTEDSLGNVGDTAKETAKQTEGLRNGTKNNSKAMFEAFVKADLFTGALSKLGDVALDVADYIWHLDEATEEYRVSQGKLNAAFDAAGFSADTAKMAYEGLYRITGDVDRATEASQLLAQLARNTQDVADWTTIATGVVGKFGDSLPIESLIESSNETARVGQVTGTLADALNWAGTVGEDEFNTMLADCKTQEERVELITRTLMGTYEDAAHTFEETSGSVMAARDSFLAVQEATAGAGEAVQGLKNSMKEEAQYASMGFHDSIKELVEALDDLIDGTKSQRDLYRDWVSTIEAKISTGSIDEATGAFEDLGRVIHYFEEHPIDAIFQFGGLFSAKGAQSELNDLLEVAEQRFSGTAGAAEEAAAASTDLEEAMEPIIATAGGVSVQLGDTGLSAEEASGRLKTYTDAATNMFDRISTKSEVSYSQAVANLEANIKAVEDFSTNLASLAGALPPQLAELFAAGGPQMYAGVVSMLAKANQGADEGLTKLNEAYSRGGNAAVEAFLVSLGMIPSDVENPATIISQQMDNDTSMEAAGRAVVDRTNEAIVTAVETAGFDGAGEGVISDFISGMEAKQPAANSMAHRIGSDANLKLKDHDFYGTGRSVIQSFIDGMESKRSDVNSRAFSIGNDADNNLRGPGGGSTRAGGLDIVPYNGYPATLHAGEAVLTAREAAEWRGGNTDNSRNIIINQYIQTVPQTPAELAAATESYFEQAVWTL